MQWKSTHIPKPLAEEIQKIMVPLGYVSLSQFVTEASRNLLWKMKTKVEEIEHERDVGRQALGKTDKDEGEL